ncbi:MAG: DUF2065 family protein [Pseudorhodobacter sp.]|nr:DUF2065 family protein [Pseudorhodobacter sp.]
MSVVVLAFGLVLVVEGLAFALAPSRLIDLVALIASLSPQRRRGLGLGALALGVGLIWLSHQIGA